MTPRQIAIQQLEAYNKHDLDAFCALFAIGCSNQGGTSQDFTDQIAASDAGFVRGLP